MNYAELPPIAHDPAHEAVVATLARLRQNQIERFLARVTGSHTAALFLREVLYWLRPNLKAPQRPRSTVYRDGHYWMTRTQEEWYKESFFTRSQLETIYGRCESVLEIDHFMYGKGSRQTHYRIKFEKLREEMERDETLQACLQSDLDAAKSRTAQRAPASTPECGNLRNPSVLALGEQHSPPENTCACSPSAPSGAAAPEPPPPARRALDSVEAPTKPEVKSFQQAQAILQAAEGGETRENLKRLAPYGERTRLFLGYMLIWKTEHRKQFGGQFRFTEAHYLQAGELADNEGVSLNEFAGTLLAAWEVVPKEGFDPCFMTSRHSKKFTSFCKHFRRMQNEILG